MNDMKLYHYTSVPLAESILSTSLKYGHMSTMSGIVRDVVWLTTDSSSEGHGLLTGDEKNLTDEQVRHMEAVQGGPLRNHGMQKKTAVRLTYSLPEEWTYIVQNYVEYCRNNEGGVLFAKTMGLSCFVDINAMDDKRLKSLMKTVKTKEKTWWISFMAIPSDLIAAIDTKAGNRYEPYHFEQHGRTGMAEVGFFSPSAVALATLQSLLRGQHPLEYANARVFCAGPTDEPKVAIRGSGTERIFTINDGKLLQGSTFNEHPLHDWVLANRIELLACWEQAKKSYNAFYPNQ